MNASEIKAMVSKELEGGKVVRITEHAARYECYCGCGGKITTDVVVTHPDIHTSYGERMTLHLDDEGRLGWTTPCLHVGDFWGETYGKWKTCPYGVLGIRGAILAAIGASNALHTE